MSVLSRQDLQQRINDTLYANVTTDITPQMVNDLLHDLLDSGYVHGDLFPAFTTDAGRVGDTFRFQFAGEPGPSLFALVQDVAAPKPVPDPAASQPQYLRLTQPGGSGGSAAGEYLSLKGNTPDTPVAGPLYVGSTQAEADGAILLYDYAIGGYYSLEAYEGLNCTLKGQGVFYITPSVAMWAMPLIATNKKQYDDTWDSSSADLYVTRHKLEAILDRQGLQGAVRESIPLMEYINNSKSGQEQPNVRTLLIDDDFQQNWGDFLDGLPFRMLDASKEELLQYPLRLVNVSSSPFYLYSQPSRNFESMFIMTRGIIPLTPGGSWIDFVWCPDSPGTTKDWYMTNARIYNSPDWY